nr:ABC transporter substrate-binding protein [uncultured Marinifilum sp.]
MKKVTISPQFYSSGSECLNSFYDGKVDVAFMGSVPFIIGRASGVPIKILALVNRSKGGEAVLVRSGSNPLYSRNKELKVCTAFGSTAHYLLQKYTHTLPAGIDIYNTFMSPELQMDAFNNGFVDAISLWEPYVSFAANNFDASIVYDDSKLAAGGLNFLVVRESYASKHPEIIEEFIKALKQSTNWIKGNMMQAVGIIDKILKTPDITAYDLSCNSLSMYDWEISSFLPELMATDIQKELLDISTYLTSDNIAAPLVLHPSNIFCDRTNINNEKLNYSGADIRIGYSSDIMCTPFLIASALNIWSEYDFFIPRHSQLISERLLHYDQSTQDSLMKIFSDIKKKNTKSAAISLRSLLERCLKYLCKKFNLKIAENKNAVGLFSYLDALKKAKVMPSEVESYSHLIRLFGNEAAHQTTVNDPDLPLLLEFTMRIFDWSNSDGSGHCPNCNLSINLEWHYCAGCGKQLMNTDTSAEEIFLPLNGNEIKEILGIGPGPLIGKAQDYLRQKIKDNPDISKEKLYDLLIEWKESNIMFSDSGMSKIIS